MLRVILIKLILFQSTNLIPLAEHYTTMRRYNPPSTEGSAARSSDSSSLDSILGLSLIDSPSAVDLSEVSLINPFDIIICENYVT